MKLEKVGQVGIAVKDARAAAKGLEEKFGMGPFAILEFDSGKAFYKGEERAYQSVVAICNFNGLVIELMQQTDGNTINNDPDYLPPGGQGIHHLGFFVPNAEEMAKQFEDEGGKVLQKSHPTPNAMTIYLDTKESCGFLVELIQIGAPK